jgi:hypothetical protein
MAKVGLFVDIGTSFYSDVVIKELTFFYFVFLSYRSGRPPSIKEPLLFCPIQGQGQFVLKPSISSAFCPLKNMYTQGTSFSQTTPTSIEGH